MIPKIIHYCWFGSKSKPENVINYIETWKVHCPDYEIKEWNENNYDINSTIFTKEAYAVKKYAFVADYVRLIALYNEGGIYLDTDVEVLKTFDTYLNHSSFMGFEMRGKNVGTAVLGAAVGQPWIKEIMSYYENNKFIKWYGRLNNRPNPELFHKYLNNYGIECNDKMQILTNEIAIYPSIYFSAKDYHTNELLADVDTVSIHHYAATWVNKDKRWWKKVERLIFNIRMKIKINR